MYEYHGWIVLRESLKEVDEGGLGVIVQAVTDRVLQIGDGNPLACVRSINGAEHLVVSGFANHRPPEAESVLDLYRFVAETAPGSYGLLHVWDDEDLTGKENEFQV